MELLFHTSMAQDARVKLQTLDAIATGSAKAIRDQSP